MRNKAIKDYAKEKGVLLWEIAEKLNICDSNFSRRLRKEFSEAEAKQIYAIIDSISADSQRNST